MIDNEQGTWRVERDSMGEVLVPGERLWGAQTERSRRYFAISQELVPSELLRALALVKKACAEVNVELGQLDTPTGAAICRAADEVMAGAHDAEFPLVVWQTGSGTQTNMNMNEVLANRASELLGGGRGGLRKVHPNDHVNRSQSSNDVIPSALSLAAVQALESSVLPNVRALRDAIEEKAGAFGDLVKLGRTHLMDATPITLGQEFGGWVAQLQHGEAHLRQTIPHLSELALGGTAVGTGLNAPPEFGSQVAHRLSELSGLKLVTAENKFEALAAHDAVVFAHGALKTLAGSLSKIANDIRWLGSGPRAGLAELQLPANEPGSSIMPGKVNPTQSEALLMICARVLGNDVTIGLAGASGNLQLNVYKPVLAFAFLESCRLLADGCRSFRDHCIVGLEPNRERLRANVENSLMLVTALAPHIGYDAAAQIAKYAHEHSLSLREAATALNAVSASDFDRWVRPGDMTTNAPKPGE